MVRDFEIWFFFYIICDEIKSVLIRKIRIYFIVTVRTKIYENKKAPSRKFSSHGVLSLTLKTALSSQPDFYWNPHPANLNFMSSLFTTLCYYYFFSLSGMLKSSSFSLLYPTNWKTETEKKFDSCKYNSLKTFPSRFIFWSSFRAQTSIFDNSTWSLLKVLSQETSISKVVLC